MSVTNVAVEGRQAKCGCGKVEPSDNKKLFGFQSRAAGSREAEETCGNCHYSVVAHTDEVRSRPHNSGVCEDFTPRGEQEFDSYYCGCRGWD